MTRAVDKDVREQTRLAWVPIGCAICGEPVFELHHLRKRSAGGGDHYGNLIALCGEFQKNAHHRAVEDGHIDIYPTQNGGLAWQDRRTGESGVCRTPGLEAGAVVPDEILSSQPGVTEGAPPPLLNAGLNGSKTPPEVAVLPDGGPIPPAATVSAPARAPVAATSSPAARFAVLHALLKDAAQQYMRIAANLLDVEETKEWQQLEFESFHSYWGEEGLGLPQGTVSKMLKVAKAYRERWDDAVQTGASVEKLYLAQRAADDVDEALGLAANMPTYELAALAKNQPPPGEQERCPTCGQPVRATNSRGEAKKDTDA